MLRQAHMNGKSPMFSAPAPFAMSFSKGKRGVFQHPANEHWSVTKGCLYNEPVRPIRPFRQAHGPDPSTGVRVMVRSSNHEVLEGSTNHPECNYEPRDDTCAIRVTSVQDRICVDYFFRIGAELAVSLANSQESRSAPQRTRQVPHRSTPANRLPAHWLLLSSVQNR